VVTMATADRMTSFLASIESNVKRFPEDQLSIYQCIRAVARRHGAFSTVPEILNLNKMYLPIEEMSKAYFEIPCPGTQPLRDLGSALTVAIDKDATSHMEVEDSSPSESTNVNGVSPAYATTISAIRVQTEQDAEAFYERALRNLDRINLLWRNQQPS
ncbi:hypothetical protein BGZ65_007789, partial [Modicella reniformis]